MKAETDVNGLQKDKKVTASILDAFDSLKAIKDDAKLNGGAKLISLLEVNESEKDTSYVLKRLIRSLGANVPDIRAGYFATLVALLTRYDNIPVTRLLDLAGKELHANSSSKSEVGDVALGQILVCSAVFRSGLMLRCTDEEQKEILQLLLNASKKKSYLSTLAYLLLLDFVNTLNEDQFSTIVWSNIKQEFKIELKEHSLDSLYFLLMVSTKFPSKVKLRKLLGTSEILCEDNIHAICEKLLAGINFNTISHPIYKEIGMQIAESPHLQLFWTSGIDSQFLKHNRNRELVALNILTSILNNIKNNVQVIPELLSKNFFKLFMDWFKGLQTASKIRSKKDIEDESKIMIKKGKEVLNALAKALKHEKVDNEIRIETLKRLLFYPGEMNFTEVSGTSIVKSIISDLDEHGVKKMAKLFKGVLLNTSKKVIKDDLERSWYNNERVKAAELISYLVSHEAVRSNTEFKLTYMKILMCFGFFKLGGDNNVAVSTELSGAIKSCFYRCFTSRFSNVDDLVSVLSSLNNFICSILEKNEVRAKIEKQFPEENMECWKLLTEVCQNIENNDSKSKIDNVFLILLYQLGLFLFSEPTHVKMARSSIKELKSCYDHYRKNKKKKPKKFKEESLAEEPEWIEVLIEVLLSILSTESSVLRSIVQCVFSLLWEDLTPSCMGQIVSVLDPESETNPLTHDDESGDDDSDNEDEKDDEENGENDIEENESDSNIEDEDDDEEMKTPDQLRLAIQKALGAAAPDTDTESVDADMIDEEEGKKLDEALAEAFKQFHQGKGKKAKKDRKDKKTLSDFRIRVLDLVDIYLEKDPSMDICLSMIAPLIRCLEFCLADNQFRELENRVRKTIKNMAKIKKFSSTDDVTIDVLCDYLKANIDKGTRSHFMFQALGDVVTCIATFIINCSHKIETKAGTLKKTKTTSPLVEIFKEALQSYFRDRTCLLPIIFFHNVLQLDWQGNYELVPILIENMFSKDVRQYRRNESIELLAGFYRSLKRSVPDNKLLIKLTSFEENFQTALIQTLKDESGFEAKNKYFVVLKKLINTMKMFHESCKVNSSLDFKTLLDTLESSKKIVKVKNNNTSQSNDIQSQESMKDKKKRKILQVHENEPRQKIRKLSN